jgi:hypothetical protein
MAWAVTVFSSSIRALEQATVSFFGAGGHTRGAGALVGVDMEAMRAERRGVDMLGLILEATLFLTVYCFNFLEDTDEVQHKKSAPCGGFFIFCYFLMCI